MFRGIVSELFIELLCRLIELFYVEDSIWIVDLNNSHILPFYDFHNITTSWLDFCRWHY